MSDPEAQRSRHQAVQAWQPALHFVISEPSFPQCWIPCRSRWNSKVHPKWRPGVQHPLQALWPGSKTIVKKEESRVARANHISSWKHQEVSGTYVVEPKSLDVIFPSSDFLCVGLVDEDLGHTFIDLDVMGIAFRMKNTYLVQYEPAAGFPAHKVRSTGADRC